MRKQIWAIGLMSALLWACGPYVAPRLPIFTSANVDYRVIPVNADTAELWQASRAPTALLPLSHSPNPAMDSFYDYILGPGDRISLLIYTFDATGEQTSVRVFPEGLPIQGEEELLVAADGSVLLPYIGRLQVAGKPFAEVEKMIESGLKRFFVNPQFQAQVTQFAAGRALVMGEVNNPGEIFLSHSPLTVTGAIEAAGGLLPTADYRGARLTRANGLSETLDLTALYFENDARANSVLRAGDRISIPRGHGNQIFVTGEVLEPQALTMHPQGFSLPEALQQANGINFITGDPSHIYVLRSAITTPKHAHIRIFHLDSSNLANLALADHFKLHPRDIIYVSQQPITVWNRLLSQFMPSGFATTLGPQFSQN